MWLGSDPRTRGRGFPAGSGIGLSFTERLGAPAPPPVKPVSLTSNVKDGATGVKVDTLVRVKAAAGTITKVTLTYRGQDRRGLTVKGQVAGAVSKDRTRWTATERLEPDFDYSLAMAGKNTASVVLKQSRSFRTHNLTLAQQTFPTLYPLSQSRVGVGMPVILTFDVPVQNRKEFEKNLHVTASPAQAGSWRWFSALRSIIVRRTTGNRAPR